MDSTSINCKMLDHWTKLQCSFCVLILWTRTDNTVMYNHPTPWQPKLKSINHVIEEQFMSQVLLSLSLSHLIKDQFMSQVLLGSSLLHLTLVGRFISDTLRRIFPHIRLWLNDSASESTKVYISELLFLSTDLLWLQNWQYWVYHTCDTEISTLLNLYYSFSVLGTSKSNAIYILVLADM